MNLHLLRGVFSGLIADLAGYIRGSIIRGGVAAWEVYDAKTAGQILVGDGTDVRSVAVDGDATLIGVLDTRYLRLSAVNDPVTAGLEINALTAAEPVLILQTTDDDATSPILEVQASGGGMLTEIQADGDVLLTDGVRLLLGTGADGEFYSSADNVIIRNTALDKEIDIFVNDGGVNWEIISIGHNMARLYIQAKTADKRCILLRPAAGQTANLLEWDTSGLAFAGAMNPVITGLAGPAYNTMDLTMTINAPGASTASYRGFYGGPKIKAGNVQNYTGEVAGLFAQPAHLGTGIAAKIIGNRISVQNASTGTVTLMQGFFIALVNTGGGTVTNAEGITLSNINIGGVTNFAIKTALGDVQFGDQVSILGSGAADIQLLVRGAAAQSGDLQEWQSSASAILSRINKDGYIMTRKVAAPADGDVATSELALWFDNTNGNAFAMFKGKTVDGTVVTGSVALA